MKRNEDEARAWIGKYFKVASIVKILSLLDIRGVNDNKLISNPIYAPTKESDEIIMFWYIVADRSCYVQRKDH